MKNMAWKCMDMDMDNKKEEDMPMNEEMDMGHMNHNTMPEQRHYRRF
jgi:hypothetical protein